MLYDENVNIFETIIFFSSFFFNNDLEKKNCFRWQVAKRYNCFESHIIY